MVRAILDGQKTQTRRVVKPQPEQIPSDFPRWRGEDPSRTWWSCRRAGQMVELRDAHNFCPYGQPADRLWVKETFVASVDGKIIYRASIPYGNLDCHFKPWRPSIFMSRKASRITLEITGVRVERLNNISEADARAEGIESGRASQLCGVTFRDYLQRRRDSFEDFTSPVESYRSLWESINGAGSWAANPWVWVVEFRADRLREGAG